MEATTPIASSTALSISSTTWEVEPLNNKVTAFGSLHSFTKIMSSPDTLSSATNPASPRSSADKSSMFVTIFAPVAFANFSMSDFLTLLVANIPALDK